jgi:drug/metabolite transporter (DMT)-like permease
MTRRPGILANDALLLLTAAIWGFAFVAQRAGMEHVGPFTYTAVRFALGSLALIPLVLLEARAARRAAVGTGASAAAAATDSPSPSAAATGTLRAGMPPTTSPSDAAAPRAAPPRPISPLAGGLLAGIVLFGGAILQQVGLVWTTAGKAGFITGLYVVLVPLVGLLWGQRPGWSRWLGAAFAAAGLFFLSVTSSFSLARGDAAVLVGALFWTAHVHVVGWLSPRTRPVALSCVQFAVCSILSAVILPFVERIDGASLAAAAVPILYGGLVSVGIAYTLQVVAQRHAPPAHAAILLSLETVFAALGGWLVLGERLSPRSLAGCGLMLAGMVCSQLPLFLPVRRLPQKNP